MDPISLSLSAIGFGMQLFGGMGQADVANQVSQISNDKAQHEMQINTLKQQQVRLEANRSQMQNIRNVQQARAMSLSSATNQGAQFGSGLQGGQSEITAQGAYNMVGVNSALQTSEGIYGNNQSITGDNARIATLQGQSATDQGISTIGGALLKAAPSIGSFSKGFGGLFSGGGNYSGTPGASNTGGLY